MSASTVRAVEQRVLEEQSPALKLLTAIRAVTAITDRIYLGMGYTCGALFLLLAFFITYQVIVR